MRRTPVHYLTETAPASKFRSRAVAWRVGRTCLTASDGVTKIDGLGRAAFENNDDSNAVQPTHMLSEKQVTGGDGAINLARGPVNGSPLLFLHGVGRAWQDISQMLGALAWRWHVCALDFRGHGRSARTPGKYLVRDYVRDAV